MVTIRDVSKLAKVSTSTVSRVICNNGIVSQETRKRVLDAIQQLGYCPNPLAQGLKYNRSNVIGVVVPDLSSPYFAHMLRGVEQAVENANLNMIVCSGHADQKSEIKAVKSLLGHRCAALILNIEATLSESEDDLTGLIQERVPVVMLGLHVPRYSQNSVYTDNERGGFLATEYLIRQGHTQIVHLSGPLKYRDSRARLAGYKCALKQAELPDRANYVIEGEEYTEEFGYRAVLDLLEKQVKFSAVFAGDDEIAAGVMEALRAKGLKVPEEVSVIGFDDMFYARLMHPKLTTIRQPIVEMGKAAGELAISLISKKTPTRVKKVFAPQLIIRSSVARMT
jgi:LacI family transcriptional regulator